MVSTKGGLRKGQYLSALKLLDQKGSNGED